VAKKSERLPAIIDPSLRFIEANKGISKSVGRIYQKAMAFDIIKEHREHLIVLNSRIRALAKSSAKGQGIVLSQLQGQRDQIEKTIESIFSGVK